ncbi:hypothetical protein HYT53_02265, partial [Candidatus Woesearchaeota archaeon]|nr:hypothetical protein [Candidatus Woesearchaeota archaeon]
GLLANSITGNVVAEEVFAEMDVLEKEAKEIESNTTPKILIVLSPGWYGAEEELAFAQPSADLGYQKVNGSIILRLG